MHQVQHCVAGRLVWVDDSHRVLICSVTSLTEINTYTSSTPQGTVIYYRVKLVSDGILLTGHVGLTGYFPISNKSTIVPCSGEY